MSPVILHIETSNTVCSVCLSKGSEVVALRENGEGNMHAALLTPFIQQVLAEANITPYGLDAVSLSKGPGSYTGLRIGASAAKALCYATGKPLIAVDTLQAMVAGYLAQHGLGKDDVLFCPMIDARRMEVYAALYDSDLREIKAAQPWIITGPDFFEPYSKDKKVVCFGNGAAKATALLEGDGVLIDGGHYLGAAHLVALALERWKAQAFDDTSYFEPQYLKSTVIS